ncbi:MAG: hemolysin family protein [Ktedonobacteraceae bacterium]
MAPITEIIIILLLILANSVLSMSETAFVSVRKARLQQRAEDGEVRARDALELANSPDKFLSTIELGMTLISILTGVFGGAMIAQWLAGYLRLVPWLAAYSDGFALTIIVIIITYLSLVIGELVPKRLALSNPERVTIIVARTMRMIARIVGPIVTLLSASTEGVLRLIGWRPSTDPPISQEEIRILIEQGRQVGVFEAEEQELVERIFTLRDRRVKDLMRRRPDIVWLDIAGPRETLNEVIKRTNYSRFPVCRGSLDNLLGIVRVKDLFLQKLAGSEELDIEPILQEPIYVFERTTTLKVLEMFRRTGSTLALVVQEDGNIQGLITLYDILRAIVGDVSFPDDIDDSRIVQREGESYILEGSFPIDKLKELLKLKMLPEEEQGGYSTVGGLILMTLGHIPRVGEVLNWGGYRFEVRQMEARRVTQVAITTEISKPVA